VVNPGFETGSISPWNASGSPTPSVTTAQHQSGSYAAAIGTFGCCPFGGDSTLSQSLTIPASATTATLTLWYRPSASNTSSDWQEAQIRSSSGTTLAQVFKVASNSQTWTLVTYDLKAFRGQTIQLWFNAHNGAFFSNVGMYLDDVAVTVG
jgi:hypothetical protein